jgi:hypothetical protein
VASSEQGSRSAPRITPTPHAAPMASLPSPEPVHKTNAIVRPLGGDDGSCLGEVRRVTREGEMS